MSRTIRASTAIVNTGIAETLTTVDNANGELVGNNGNTFLAVHNATGGSLNVTIGAYPAGNPNPTPGPGLAVSSQVVAVAAGATEYIGPFPPSVFNNAAQQIQVDYSGVMSAQALRFTPNGG